MQPSGVVGSDINGNPTGYQATPGTGVIAYSFARLKIRYAPWISYTVDVDYGVEPLVVSGAQGATYKWSSDGVQLDPSEVPVVRQQTMALVLTSYDHLTIPDFTTYNGYVNSVAINIPQINHSFSTGTLLMDGASTQTIVQSTGQPYKSFKAILKWLPNGWNKFFRPSTGTWQTVTDAAGNPPYSSVDFTPLFA